MNSKRVDAVSDESLREHLRVQLSDHLRRLPESTRLLHRWMKRLDVLAVGIVLAAFLVALYLSINWKSVNPLAIPIAWFLFAASAAPVLLFLGLDAIILRAFPPVIWPGKPPKFVTGRSAVWTGAAFVLLALVLAAFWGSFAFAVGTLNFPLVAPLASLAGIAIGIVMVISIVYKLIHDVSQPR